ncbi:MAG: hypothetical protein ABI042_06260 [Verrucomicrobiota bacterium]
MQKKLLFVLAAASVLLVSNARAATFADAVVSYNPGTGYSAQFTNTATVLGAPSQVNPYGEPTDPFDPPYGTDQILSIGAGGSVTVKFHTPILNHPKNAFGIDFIIFGNSGFIITNDFDLNTFDWVGTPATDSSLFGANSGSTRVSVSRDGVNFFALNPALAPTVDTLFPTDGSGNFQTPLDPTLTQSDFAGATLDDMTVLYNGSAGGAGYDISWAQDANGNSVSLPVINFVRVEVISGKSDIDGFAATSRH